MYKTLLEKKMITDQIIPSVCTKPDRCDIVSGIGKLGLKDTFARICFFCFFQSRMSKEIPVFGNQEIPGLI